MEEKYNILVKDDDAPNHLMMGKMLGDECNIPYVAMAFVQKHVITEVSNATALLALEERIRFMYMKF